MEELASPGQSEEVPENQVQLATDRGGTWGGRQKGERGPHGAASLLGSPGVQGWALMACIPGCVSQDPWWSLPRPPAAWP